MRKSLFLILILSQTYLGYANRDSLDQIIQTSKNDTVLSDTYEAISDIFYQVEPDSCEYFTKKAIEHAQIINHTGRLMRLQNTMGLCELHLENYDTAIYWFKISLTKAIDLEGKQACAMILNNIGASYVESQKSATALKYLLKAYEIAGSIDNNEILMLSEMNMGNAYNELGQDSIALDFYTKSMSRIDEESDTYHYTLNFMNIGLLKMKMDSSIKSAGPFLWESYGLAMRHEFPNLGVMCSNNLAGIYLGQSYFDADSAWFWLERMKEMSERSNTVTHDVYLSMRLGEYYRATGDYQTSLTNLLEGYVLLDKVQGIAAKYELEYELSDTYEKLGDFKNAHFHYKKGQKIEKELYNNTNTQIFANLKNNHEIEKRDQTIALAQKDGALKDEQIKSNQNRIRLFVFGTVLLVILLAFIVFFLVQKNKNNRLLKEQNELIEIQRTSIAAKQTEILSSINYASRIQSAILPESAVLNAHLKNGFVLYMPKDVVSGDFYWTEKLNEHEVLVAVADCTGHGVPGAMVSVVCNNAP